ncbi:nitroreductase [Hyaloraphidium curvatum]|nr:nitroreductase [Hyaloraphidium curvatum]
MKVSDAIHARHSCRQFLADRPVPEETVRRLLELAARAPSGGNTQPWHVYVVTGKAKEELSKAARAEMGKGNFADKPEYQMYPKPADSAAYMARRRKLGFDMYDLMGVGRTDAKARGEAAARNFDFFDAPVGLIVTVDRFSDRNAWGHVGMFLQTFCLAAAEMGLATCLQEAWSQYHTSVVYKNLPIPQTEIVWCGIALGYEDKSAKVNTLKSEREPVDVFTKFFDTLPAKL